MTAYTCIVLTVSLQLASIIETWTWIHHYLIWGSVMFWFYFIAIYSIQNPDYIGEAVHLFAIAANSPNFWLLLVLIPIACLLPDFLIRAVRRHLYPADHQIIAEAELAKLSGKVAPDGGSAPHGTLSLADGGVRVPSMRTFRV